MDAPGVLDVESAPQELATDALYEDPAAAASQKPAPKNLLRVEPLELEWQRIGCSYRAAAGTKVVLQDVYGRASPGEMQALLGPSGAGKSTLMDILAQRKSVGTLTGQLLVSGRPVARGFIRKTAYVPQEDNFVPTMTTMETMRFYAAIILPDEMGRAGRQQRLEEVLDAVGLGTHHKTLVGGVLPGGLMLRGLSGGERKRLSIAVGILAAPSVVYLDEPTSGLDSFAALTVMGYMKRMARTNGQVVIASIHQPRSAIWSMFDTVTLLSCGRLMYTGIRDGLVEWFASRGFEYDAGVHGVASD
ncbi:ABC transporter G family protein, partial [Monoraphidium neglectum]